MNCRFWHQLAAAFATCTQDVYDLGVANAVRHDRVSQNSSTIVREAHVRNPISGTVMPLHEYANPRGIGVSPGLGRLFCGCEEGGAFPKKNTEDPTWHYKSQLL